MSARGFVHEVFRSIQGEGPHLGVLQVFVRLAGCSARCRYCDSIEARERSGECRLYGAGEPELLPNPVVSDEIASFVRTLADVPGFHSVSVTGGEPLEQPAFLADLAGLCRAAGLPVYLETNGLHADDSDESREAAGLVDFVSLDIKLPSLCPGVSLDAYRRAFSAFEGIFLFCKVVVAPGFSLEEVEEAARIVGEYGRGTTLVIQPATPVEGSGAVAPGELLACHAAAARHLDDVRVIPQCHGLLGLR